MTDIPPSVVASESVSPDSSSEGVPSQDAPPVWFTAFAEQHAENQAKLEGRISELGRDNARFRRVLKGATPESTGEQPADEATSVPPVESNLNDPLSLMKLGEVRANLPERGRELLDQKLDAGMGAREILEFVEFANAVRPVSGGTDARVRQAQQGTAASAAPRTSPGWPNSKREYYQMMREDPKRFETLQKDDTFDPAKLPDSPLR